MHRDEPYILTILGRDYRFKNPSDKVKQLTVMASQLDERLALQAAELPLATRDQLLVLTAINLLTELAEQQQLQDKQFQSLLALIQTAE
ncbi:cell division protein ZapA [Alishewanella tabrizica]|uniref:Z ring-associated protein ZapA n=1 Tax=Alishewanella tabrizica TaxID=671278 RepID=A0ABQ2WJY2_9ALTE|nr:cell division protein ZapA [Alishewanella tabrizica]GGW57543.1 hypothetical protein GCM10008111_12020 [Alishewanella tabrizica]